MDGYSKYLNNLLTDRETHNVKKTYMFMSGNEKRKNVDRPTKIYVQQTYQHWEVS